jgi:glycosyltransferase involved in cell wall biosynthesis
MRLLIVTRERPGDFRFGLGKAVRRIAAELLDRGHEVELISASDWTVQDRKNHAKTMRFLQLMGAPEPLASTLAERWVQARRTRVLLRRAGYTHLWFQDPWLSAAYLMLRPFGRSSRDIRWGVSEHGLGTFAHAVALDGLLMPKRWRRVLLWLEARSLRRADFVLLPSKAVDCQLRQELHLPTAPEHWAVLGYGRPSAPTMSREEARRDLGWDAFDFYALVLGRTAPVKRIDLILNACLLAQRTGAKVRLVIVGGGLHADLQRLAAGLSCPPICIEVDDPSVYLAAADLYLSACAVESFGLSNLEAVTAGLPCVVAAGGGATEVLQNGAWLIEPTAENFAEAICLLFDQPNLRARWAEAALARAACIPTWAQLAVQYEAHIGGEHA